MKTRIFFIVILIICLIGGVIFNVTSATDNIEKLIEKLSTFRKDDRDEAMWRLVSIGEPAVEPLIKSLQYKHIIGNKTAAETLGEIGKPSFKPLIAALKDPNNSETFHYYAAEALVNTIKTVKDTFPPAAALSEDLKKAKSEKSIDVSLRYKPGILITKSGEKLPEQIERLKGLTKHIVDYLAQNGYVISEAPDLRLELIYMEKHASTIWRTNTLSFKFGSYYRYSVKGKNNNVLIEQKWDGPMAGRFDKADTFGENNLQVAERTVLKALDTIFMLRLMGVDKGEW